jgi:hypothetical protein
MPLLSTKRQLKGPGSWSTDDRASSAEASAFNTLHLPRVASPGASDTNYSYPCHGTTLRLFTDVLFVL